MLDLAVAVWILGKNTHSASPGFGNGFISFAALIGGQCAQYLCRATVSDRASPKLSAEPANRPPAASSPERPWPPQGSGDGAPDPLKALRFHPLSLSKMPPGLTLAVQVHLGLETDSLALSQAALRLGSGGVGCGDGAVVFASCGQALHIKQLPLAELPLTHAPPLANSTLWRPPGTSTPSSGLAGQPFCMVFPDLPPRSALHCSPPSSSGLQL